MTKTIWSCKIGETDRERMPNGCDAPMRQAVEEAYIALTGETPQFIFSRWGADLDEGERKIVENMTRKSRNTHKLRVGQEMIFDEFVLRGEKLGDDDFVTTFAYTPNGEYIGDEETALRLVCDRGIRPQLIAASNRVCSIGYQPNEQKWYGWSHRAMYGFGVGDVVTEGDCTAEYLPIGFTAKTLTDAKKMAIAFAQSVS